MPSSGWESRQIYRADGALDILRVSGSLLCCKHVVAQMLYHIEGLIWTHRLISTMLECMGVPDLVSLKSFPQLSSQAPSDHLDFWQSVKFWILGDGSSRLRRSLVSNLVQIIQAAWCESRASQQVLFRSVRPNSTVFLNCSLKRVVWSCNVVVWIRHAGCPLGTQRWDGPQLSRPFHWRFKRRVLRFLRWTIPNGTQSFPPNPPTRILPKHCTCEGPSREDHLIQSGKNHQDLFWMEFGPCHRWLCISDKLCVNVGNQSADPCWRHGVKKCKRICEDTFCICCKSHTHMYAHSILIHYTHMHIYNHACTHIIYTYVIIYTYLRYIQHDNEIHFWCRQNSRILQDGEEEGHFVPANQAPHDNQ